MTATLTTSRPTPMTVSTHCPYCALQCGMALTPLASGGVRVAPRDFPVNQGGLCQKGWTAADLLTTPDRLTVPLTRNGPVDWDTALDQVAVRIREIQDAYGPDAVAVFGGGGLTNEKAYLLGKFARVALRTSKIDYNGRFCMSSAAAAGIAAFGLDRGLPFPVTDLDGADVVLLAGANVAETMPPLMSHLRAARLIVIDPRPSATAERATASGGVHLAPAPGTDLPLALAILHVIVAEDRYDRPFIAEYTNGFDAVRRAAGRWWPERAERITGVPAADIRRAAHLLADAHDAFILTGRGTEQHSNGTDTAAGWINVALALGLPGREGSGYGCLTGQGNGQGGREHGQKADQLPGYRKITDPAARTHVAGVWGVDPSSLPGPGPSAYELLDSLGRDGGPRALLVFGSNPLVSAPYGGNIAERLATLDLLVVADFVPSETAQHADVVLPVTQWAEEDGTMTNLEGRVLRRHRAVDPPPGVRDDLWILSELAVRLGQPRTRFPYDTEAVFNELRHASAGGPADYSGITYDRLAAGDALHWPCAEDTGPGSPPGTPRPFAGGFAHPDGRARFAAVDHRDPAETPDPAYPLRATTGRVLQHYQSGAQTRRVAELADAVPEAYVEVHPDTAARSGLADGAAAYVISRRGRTRARVRCAPGLRADTVFLPFHFPGDQSANALTNPALDPASRMPEFKACAVRLEPAP